MLVVCYSAKGGQGCSTVAVMLAVSNPGSVLVDAGGDLPSMLSVPPPDGAGLGDVMALGAPLAATVLDRCAAPVGPTSLVGCGGQPLDRLSDDRWCELATVLDADPRLWVLDAGTGPGRLAAHRASVALLVSRYCYLALLRASRLLLRRTGVVTVREAGRSLDQGDVERVLGVPVMAEFPWDESIARAVDAGLTAQVPRCAAGELDRLNAHLFGSVEASPRA